jgi:hypothetical protein
LTLPKGLVDADVSSGVKRRAILAAAETAVSLAGCLGSIGEQTPELPGGQLVQSGPGDYPHEIYVHNALDRDVTLRLTVDRVGTGICRRDHTVAPGAGAVVAGITRETLPEGERRLAVTATLPSGRSSRVDVDVTDCLGSVDFSIDSEGELRSTYSIC